MHTALISCRAWWNRAPWRQSALVTTRLPLPITPNAALQACLAIVSPTTSATVGRAIAECGCPLAPAPGVTSTSLTTRSSYVDHGTVAGRFQLDLGQVAEHLLAHVGDHDALRSELGEV